MLKNYKAIVAIIFVVGVLVLSFYNKVIPTPEIELIKSLFMN